jgi:RNA polymerase sigma factor (sigma-70 family)
MEASDPSDLALLGRWRSGDRLAGDTLFMRHFDSIHAFFRTKLVGDVEDLVQRTFMALLETSEDAPIRAVRPWLFGTARHLLLERWRTRRDFDPETSTLAELGPSPSSILAGKAEQRILAAAVRRIPLDHQILLELHYWEELSGSEIAACLGVPEGTIRSRLRRAKQELTRALSEVAQSPELLVSTLGDLQRWMAAMREQCPVSARP